MDYPQNAIVVRTYKELDRYVSAFAAERFTLLVLIGPPGVAKTQAVRAAVGARACWIDGNCTGFALYQELFLHRDELVVLDDVDSLYSDRAAVRLLKCLCQTEMSKSVAWHSRSRELDRRGIPRKFTTESKTAIIANEWRTLNRNVEAIEDRGHVLFFDPSPLEVHLRVARFFWDQQVFDFVAERLHLIERPSMRHYCLAWEQRRAGVDWRRFLLRRWGLTNRRLLVAELRADPRYRTEEQRVAEFVRRNGGCRSSYYNHARRLRSQIEGPRILLRSPPPDDPASNAGVLSVLERRGRRLGTA
jgi:hypothetical protein